jgi:Holliday junction DNA helicase RuvA
MIDYISGKLSSKTPTYAVIECAGVGYRLNISLHTFSKIEDTEACKLFAHLSIKEDAHTLYGFADEQERLVFRHLIQVSGIGANTARLMLSSLSPLEIQHAILNKNVTQLQSIKGIGAKTAQRVILDLQDKIGKGEVNSHITHLPGVPYNNIKEEALSALVTLGFAKNAAEKIVDQILKLQGTAITVEQLIKSALKAL